MNYRKIVICPRAAIKAIVLLAGCSSAISVSAQPIQLFVSSTVTDDVKRYDGATGSFVNSFATGGGLNQPRDLAISPHDNSLLVVSEHSNEIKRYNGQTGVFLNTFVSANLSNPVGMTFGPDGNLYVANVNSDSVTRHNGTNGAFMGIFATGNGLDGPRHLKFGPNGDLFVNSSANSQIKRFNGTTGAFVSNFVTGLNGPSDLAFGPDNNLYVVERFSNAVNRFNGATGASMGTFAAGAWKNEAISLEFGPDKNLYVSINHDPATANFNGWIERFNGTTGAFMNVFVPVGSGGLQGTAEFVFRVPEPNSLLLLGLAGLIAQSIRQRTTHRLCPNLICLIAVLIAVSFASEMATAQFVTRTVTAVDGQFNDLRPRFGFEVGEGTSHVEWGRAEGPGDFTSFLEFRGYDADPLIEQPWFSPGQAVMPGQSFRAGEIRFRNGSVAGNSSTFDLDVNLFVSAFGGELQVDNHSFRENDTLRVHIRQTLNAGASQVAAADYIYFPDYPSLGSLRVFEGQSATAPVFLKFGSLIPTALGPVTDPNTGVVLPSIVDLPSPNWAERGDSGNLPASSQMPLGSGSVNAIAGSLANPFDQDMYLIRINSPSSFSASTTSNATLVADTQLFLFNLSGSVLAQNDNDPAGGSTSRIPPGAFSGPAGLYLLAISSFNSDPLGSPITGWSTGGGSSGQYYIALTGASFAFIPEPSTLVSLIAAELILFARPIRRHDNAA